MSAIHQIQVDFARLVPRLIDQGFALGYEVTGGEWHRTAEQAEWNAKRGTGIRNSLHIVRLAIDLILFMDGQYLTKTEDYEPLGMWWEEQDVRCRWGGRFTKPDGGHFSMTWDGRC